MMLGKPNTYSGNEDEFHAWKYQMVNYFGTLNTDLMAIAQLSEAQEQKIEMTTLGEVTQKHSRNLAYILSKTLAGSALTLVMSCEQGNGLEQWRHLCAREDAITDANKV